MSMFGKKKVQDLIAKKIAPDRLIKCYVCNKLFNTQPQFNEHLEHHQNKLNRTTVDEIQRKTQESFRTKRQSSALMRTQDKKQLSEEKLQIVNCKQNNNPDRFQLSQAEQEQYLEDALKESQILLEKIQFITQIAQQDSQKKVDLITEDEEEELQKTIQNEHQLYKQFCSSKNKTNVQILILTTRFEIKYFENYQQQLKHLRNLAKIAKDPNSIKRIIQTRKRICKDVFDELEQLFKTKNISNGLNIIQSDENALLCVSTGQLLHCSDCYSEISVMEQYYKTKRAAYHKQCYNSFQ